MKYSPIFALACFFLLYTGNILLFNLLASTDDTIAFDSNAPKVELPPVPMNSGIRTDLNSQQRVQWWRKARFGMFVHWGLYSIPGKGEWVMWNDQINVSDYAKLADQFTASKFSGADWVEAAKNAGMKYMIVVAKHHDGFAMFDSKADAFNAMNSAAHKDFVKDYIVAARAANIHVGLYYSPLDWRFPGYFFPGLYRDSAEAMRDKYHKQILELMSNYGPIDILWYDGGGENWLGFGGIDFESGRWKTRDAHKNYAGTFSWHDDEINQKVRAIQPELVMNDRTSTPGDFATREGAGNLGNFDNLTPWELCATLAGSWGYQPNETPMTLQQCVRLLVNTVGRDGNLLLNVGPRPDGQIEAAQVTRLKEIGDWLRINGESIYDTRGGPYLPVGEKCVSTRRANSIYVHLMEGPSGDSLLLPTPSVKLLSAEILGGSKLYFKQTPDLLEVRVPKDLLKPVDTVIKLNFADPVENLPLKKIDGW